MEWELAPARTVARRILAELFGRESDHRARSSARADAPPFEFVLEDFQLSAVRRARAILGRRGGVLIADSVGLGKTFVGLALIEDGLRADATVAVVVPAALRTVWREPLRRLAARHRAGARLRLVSHTQLSRGGAAPPPGDGPRLVVVDEAHRFRNPGTRRYAALARLAAGARVVLITATPVNNRAADLLHLLRLFAADDAFRDLGIASLAELFEEPERGADAVRRVVRDVAVRRTRALARSAGAAGFPRRAAPRVVSYEWSALEAAVPLVASLELPAHGDAALLRLGLLKRLESGAVAARKTIERHRAFTRAALDAALAGGAVRPRDFRSSAASDTDPAQLLLLGLVLEAAPPDVDLEALRAALRRDLSRLDRLRDLFADDDPKLDRLRELARALAPERAVVFTEFRDTARTLWRALAPVVRVGLVDGGGARLGLRKAGRRAVVERFAPRANGRRTPHERERVDLLVATDVLAEGLNLQDARHVVCYDLPWNPVRLLQRIGRIDRLGSPHEEVVPHLFIPARGLDRVLELTGRLRRKLVTITATVGGEDAAPLLARLTRGGADPASTIEGRLDLVLDDAEERAMGDPLERLQAIWERSGAGGITGAAADRGRRVLVGVLDAETSIAAVAVAEISGRPWLLEIDDAGRVRDGGEDAERVLRRALGSDLDASPGGDITSGIAAAAGAVRRFARSLSAAASGPPRLSAGTGSARLARRLRAAAAAHAGALPRDLLVRLDGVLAALARDGMPAADVADAIAEGGDGSLERLLDAVQPLPGGTSGAGPVPQPSADTGVTAAPPGALGNGGETRLRALLLVAAKSSLAAG